MTFQPDEERRNKYLELKQGRKISRQEREDICEEVGIELGTSYLWDTKLGKASYDSQEFLEGKTKDVDEALIKACEKNSPQALKVYYQLTQRLIEQSKQEVKVEFSTADRIRAARELREELRREWEITGNCPVCHQSETIRNQVRIYPESKYSEDREVATVGLLTRPD